MAKNQQQQPSRKPITYQTPRSTQNGSPKPWLKDICCHRGVFCRGDRQLIYWYMGVSENSGFTPKSSVLIGFSIINHPFWGTPTFFGNTHMVKRWKNDLMLHWFRVFGGWWTIIDAKFSQRCCFTWNMPFWRVRSMLKILEGTFLWRRKQKHYPWGTLTWNSESWNFGLDDVPF